MSYYLKTNPKIRYVVGGGTGTQTMYLAWKRINGAPNELWRAALSYFLRYQVRSGFYTLKNQASHLIWAK